MLIFFYIYGYIVNFRCYLVNPHAQAVQNMCAKVFRGTLKVDLVFWFVSISKKLSMIFNFFCVFLDKIDFPSQTINFCLWCIIHRLKAIVMTVNLNY